MVLGLGGCCSGVAVAAASPAAAVRQSSQGGDTLKAKQQQRVVAGEEKMEMGGEPGQVADAGKERRKKGDHQKAPPIVMHQFPFHSRPGLL
ncbi:unnamed protein product [Urochloa decumbens]|uniref:Uncharacterized protein n=1 Tax=Urochloa decumbens TaxID=240449 RepID=A0ABC9B5Z6_9POAL